MSVKNQGHTCFLCFPWIALSAMSVSIDLISSSARVTSVKSAQPLGRTSGPKDRTPGLPGSDKNHSGFGESNVHLLSGICEKFSSCHICFLPFY